MSGRGRGAIAGIALAAALVLGVRLLTGGEGGGSERDESPGGEAVSGPDVSGNGAAASDASTAAAGRSPFAAAGAARTGAEGGGAEGAGDAVAGTARAPGAGTPGADTPGADTPAMATDGSPIDLQALGRTDIPDDEFEALVARLAGDPALLQALVDELRAETDPARLARLAQLLGDVDDPAVALLASELVHSGEAAQRRAGLDLLKRVQPRSAEARALVSGLLATESDADTLVGALTAMALPGTAGADTRAELAGQVALLTHHADPAVRRTSLDILARLSDSPEHTPLLLDGLADADPTVRRTAAYAFVGREDAGEEAVRGLFATLEDEGELERTRRGAILALKGMALDETARARLLEVERDLDHR